MQKVVEFFTEKPGSVFSNRRKRWKGKMPSIHVLF